MTPDIADIIAGELKVSRGTAYDMMCEALREAQPVPVQDPVAWMVDVDLANYQGQSEFRTILAWNAKPVWSGTHEINEVLKAVPLYTTPSEQQKPWVDLSDEEIDTLAEMYGLDYMSYKPFVKDLKQRLKEKNT